MNGSRASITAALALAFVILALAQNWIIDARIWVQRWTQ